jgi:hypothetical protein
LLLVLLTQSTALQDVWWLPTVCWTASYFLSISLRHYSHTVLVFGVQNDPTWWALFKTYVAYLSTIVASTGLNLLLIGYLAQSHDAALVFTAAFSVAWSYVALRYTWLSGHDEAGGGQSDANARRGAYRPITDSASAPPVQVVVHHAAVGGSDGGGSSGEPLELTELAACESPVASPRLLSHGGGGGGSSSSSPIGGSGGGDGGSGSGSCEAGAPALAAPAGALALGSSSWWWRAATATSTTTAATATVAASAERDVSRELDPHVRAARGGGGDGPGTRA